jgi:predicted DNA-binding transcriptional regulator YafY
VLETTFEVPKDFNVSEYARGAFGIAGGKAEDVVLEVDAAVAAYVRERIWHESQSVEERPDGSLVLRMKVTPGFELKSWIKGFLPHVRVQEPASLRGAIAGELEAARAAFGPAPPPA